MNLLAKSGYFDVLGGRGRRACSWTALGFFPLFPFTTLLPLAPLAFLAILLQQNDIYILDEPYNGVDIQSNMVINSIIHELKRLGKTILISSHIFSTLTDTCDEIFLLRGGQFANQAGPENFHLIEKEMIQEVVGDKVGKLRLK